MCLGKILSLLSQPLLAFEEVCFVATSFFVNISAFGSVQDNRLWLWVIATCLVGEKILGWLSSSWCGDLHNIEKLLWTCPAPYLVLYYFSLALHKAWCWTSVLIPTGVCSQDRRAEKMRRVYEISRILNEVVDALLREADPGDADALQYSNVSSPVAPLNLVLPNQNEESFAVKFGVLKAWSEKEESASKVQGPLKVSNFLKMVNKYFYSDGECPMCMGFLIS